MAVAHTWSILHPMPCLQKPHPKHSPLAWLLVLLTVPGLAMADRYRDRQDFSLTLGSSMTRWVYHDTPRETRLRSLTASWSHPLSPSIWGGLNLTYLDTSQATHPQAAGLDTAGDGLGIDLQMQLLNISPFELGLRFAYDYARTQNTLAGQQIENTWTTTSLGLDAELSLGKTLHFLAGTAWVSVDGEEQLSGDINRLTPFKEEISTGYYAGLSIRTDSRDHIDLRWTGGYQRGVLLSFTHRY